MRFRFVAVMFGLLLPSLADAQSPPTEPAKITLTCYGYDGGLVRAYNCIPPPHLQPLMRTFVPPPGAPCDKGSVKEFPPGRIVFQIRCQDTDGTPPQTGQFDIGIQDLRRYTALNEPAQWLEFNVRGYKNLTGRIEIRARFHLRGGTFVDGSERFTGLERGQLKRALIIPSIYGVNVPWIAVTLSVERLRCTGCRRHTLASITESRTLTPGATDDHVELNYILDEFRMRGIESTR